MEKHKRAFKMAVAGLVVIGFSWLAASFLSLHGETAYYEMNRWYRMNITHIFTTNNIYTSNYRYLSLPFDYDHLFVTHDFLAELEHTVTCGAVPDPTCQWSWR